MSRARVVFIAAGVSIVLAVGGLFWRASRFGWDRGNRTAHLQQELTHRIAGRVEIVTAAARRAAALGERVSAAASSREGLQDLFDALYVARGPADSGVSITIWVPTGTSPDYRAIAWTDGPAENVGAFALDRAPALSAASGPGGLRLVYLTPVEHNGRRTGVAVAEVPASIGSIEGTFQRSPVIDSAVGPLAVDTLETRGGTARPDALTVAAPDGTPLFDVRVTDERLDAAERVVLWRVVAVAALPWVAVLAIVVSDLLRRRRASGTSWQWTMWTALITSAIVLATVSATRIIRAGDLPGEWRDSVLALAALAIAALVGGNALRRIAPVHARHAPILFALEQIVAGMVLAIGVAATARLWEDRLNPGSIEQWQLPVLPSSLPVTLSLLSLLASQIAIAWLTASVIGAIAARWRVSERLARLSVAAVCWLLPLAVWLTAMPPDAQRPVVPELIVAAALALFGMFATALRRHYRHASEVRRMALLFAALFTPVLAAYPLAAASADHAAQALISGEYAPATLAAQQPTRVSEILYSAQEDIDRVTELPDWLREAGTSVDATQLGFRVWNRTLLARNRVTSQIELYGPARTLVSRFALNVPEFSLLAQSGERTWPGSGCDWDAFGEVARFGSGERRMLHAERGLCGAGGEFLGAIVVRIIPDYRTLPFVASANPYYDALGGGDRPRADARVADLQVVVYGWSLQPIFVSGRTIWPLDDQIASQLYRSRDAFWIQRTVEGRRYHLYFLNDRGGIYALGYPAPTALQHATRLAESAAILLVVFLVYLSITAVRWPFVSHRTPLLGRLFVEFRASFHRKLLVYFVIAAIGPIIAFAIAFGFYMTDKLRADVEAEAGSVVLMARRVLDELSAAQTPIGESRPLPNDDVMVWIRQVVDQDVNLFEGAELAATSQRDLFRTGLLPTRTPSSVYARVALERQPVFVMEDRIGAFRYLLAAAPVPVFGPDVVLTVPLASRQRDIERQIDELTQGVLTGAVVLVLFAAAFGASVAGRVSDPIARLTRATRLVAAGRFDERLTATTADELGRLVEDFNTMTQVLLAQRAELARTNQLKAWAEMSRQVAHEIKNPLTPIQLAAEHLQRVHEDAGRPLGPVVDQCLTTILRQVRLLRQIASEFSTFSGTPTPRFESVSVATLIERVIEPYRATLPEGVRISMQMPDGLPPIETDRTLMSRAFTNLVENALQAMPSGGSLTVSAARQADSVVVDFVDTGVGMDAEGVQRAFEPYFSTKTAGSGLGLVNARRNIEICGGRISLASQPGAGTTVTVEVPIVRRDAPANG